MMILVRKIHKGLWIRLYKTREEVAEKMDRGDYVGACPKELDISSSNAISKFVNSSLSNFIKIVFRRDLC